MKSLKRLFVTFVVAAMVLSTMVTGFAAPFTDVVGQKFEAEVSMLQQLGVFVGKGDGTFGYNDKVTRAEMAAILVKLAGYASEVEAAKNSVAAFTDVENHWSKGEVNVAYQHGLIAGVGDGKFNPDGNVTYGEVITMVMKLLGYGPVVDNTGVWPYNYINKAATKGVELYKGVAISATAPATRGDIAKIAANALTADTLYENGYNSDGKPTYAIGDAVEYQLLGRVFDADVFEDYKVLSVPASTANVDDYNKIEIAATTSDKTLADGKYKVADGIVADVNDLLYKKISGIYKYDKEEKENVIISVVVETKASNIIVDTVSDLEFNGNDLNKIKFTKSGTKDVVADPEICLNFFAGLSEAEFKALVMSNDKLIKDTIKVTAILNDSGKVESINAWVSKIMDISGGKVYSTVIRERSSSYVRILTGAGETNTKDFYYKEIQTGVDQKNIKATVIRDGKPAKIGDLAAGDQITMVVKGSENVVVGTHKHYPYFYIVAVSEKGITNKKIDSIVGATLNDVKLVIDGVKYNLATNAVYNKGTASKLSSESKMIIDDKGIGQLADFLTDAANFVFNSNGDIAYIESVDQIASANETYSVVVKAKDKDGNYIYRTVDNKSRQEVVLLTKDGTFVTMVTNRYPIVDASSSKDEHLNEGDLIKYKVNRYGEIDLDTVSKLAKKSDITIEADNETIENKAIDGSTIYYAKIANTGNYTQDYIVTTWSALRDAYKGKSGSDKDLPAGSAFAEKDGVIKAVYVSDFSTTGGDQYGLVVGTGYDADGRYVKLLVNGVERQYKLNTTTGLNYATAGNFVTFKVQSDTATLDGNAVDEYQIASKSGDASKFNAFRSTVDLTASTRSFVVRNIYINDIGVVTTTGYPVITLDAPVYAYDATDKDAVKVISITDIKNNDYFYAVDTDGNGKFDVLVKVNKDHFHTYKDPNS